MKDILDTPEGEITIHELQVLVKEELLDYLQFDSDKETIFLQLKKKYGSKNKALILEEIINVASIEDRRRCKVLRWGMITLLIVSCLTSVYLFVEYGSPKIGQGFNWLILGQILVSAFLVFEVTKFSRKIFSLIQLLNIGKVFLVAGNIANEIYPEIILVYLLLLGSIHLVGLFIKRIGFDRYREMLKNL